MRLRSLWVAAGLLLLAAPAAAQQKGSLEIGGFGRYTGYPDSYEVQGPDDNRIGFGGRLGYFFSDRFSMELSSSYNPTDLKPNQPNIPSTIDAESRPLAYNPWNLYAMYNQPLGSSVTWMLGAGPSYTRLTKGIEESYVGVGGLTGLRIRATDWLALRLEGTIDYLPSGFNDESDMYLGAQAGLSLIFGGGCDHTNDMIGIRPSSVTLAPGETQTFMADATYCDEPDAVVYRLSGPGTIDSLTGRYTASTEGCGTVTAVSEEGQLQSSANVCTRAPAPPPPPAPARARHGVPTSRPHSARVLRPAHSG